jgi:hypothetical protein
MCRALSERQFHFAWTARYCTSKANLVNKYSNPTRALWPNFEELWRLEFFKLSSWTNQLRLSGLSATLTLQPPSYSAADRKRGQIGASSHWFFGSADHEKQVSSKFQYIIRNRTKLLKYPRLINFHVCRACRYTMSHFFKILFIRPCILLLTFCFHRKPPVIILYS